MLITIPNRYDTYEAPAGDAVDAALHDEADWLALGQLEEAMNDARILLPTFFATMAQLNHVFRKMREVQIREHGGADADDFRHQTGMDHLMTVAEAYRQIAEWVAEDDGRHAEYAFQVMLPPDVERATDEAVHFDTHTGRGHHLFGHLDADLLGVLVDARKAYDDDFTEMQARHAT